MSGRLTCFGMAGVVATAVVMAVGCETAPRTQHDRDQLIERAELTREMFIERDPGMAELFETAQGYALFPSIAKGGFGLGGAHGQGVLWEQGRIVGFCDVSQGTIGFQLGGQTYSQVIFFENREAIERFKAGDMALSAQASAVAASAGASADANYERGVLVFGHTRTGLMGEASVGGQKFGFEPLNR